MARKAKGGAEDQGLCQSEHHTSAARDEARNEFSKEPPPKTRHPESGASSKQGCGLRLPFVHFDLSL
jgi:hypothetical protein